MEYDKYQSIDYNQLDDANKDNKTDLNDKELFKGIPNFTVTICLINQFICKKFTTSTAYDKLDFTNILSLGNLIVYLLLINIKSIYDLIFMF